MNVDSLGNMEAAVAGRLREDSALHLRGNPLDMAHTGRKVPRLCRNTGLPDNKGPRYTRPFRKICHRPTKRIRYRFSIGYL